MYFIHLLPYVTCAVYPTIYIVLNRPIQVDVFELKELKTAKTISGPWGEGIVGNS